MKKENEGVSMAACPSVRGKDSLGELRGTRKMVCPVSEPGVPCRRMWGTWSGSREEPQG